MTDKKKQPLKSKENAPVYLGGATPYVPPEDGIGGRIKAKRAELNLNVEELARLTGEYDYREHGKGKGISASMLRRYEYKEGGSNPGAREICLLCDALDVSADWLVRGIETRSEETCKRKAADALFNAVSGVFEELQNPFSDISTEHQNDQWKTTERTIKLNNARQTNRQAE
jgi:transcriptional regulator with XRE-family HTH domain